DDYEDPRTAELLRRWGRHVRGSDRLFEPPADLPALREAQDVVDQGLSSARPARRRRFPQALRVVAALAAALLVVAGAFWMKRPPEGRGPARANGMGLGRVDLSRCAGTTRSAPETRFQSGDRVFIRFESARAGVACIAMLNSRGRFEPLANEEGGPPMSFGVAAGGNVLPPTKRAMTLDEAPGEESFLVIASAQLEADSLERAVA